MIPVCEPYLSGKEIEYVTNCLKTNWISSQGKYIDEFEKKFANTVAANTELVLPAVRQHFTSL